jgi:hypothetical protein
MNQRPAKQPTITMLALRKKRWMFLLYSTFSPQLLHFPTVTVNKDNYKSLCTTQLYQGHYHKPTGCKLGSYPVNVTGHMLG